MLPMTQKRQRTRAGLEKWLSRLPVAQHPRNPVFIIGCARSGTSVLKRLLGAHRQIDAYPSEANELWHPTSYPWTSGARRAPPLWQAPAAFTADSLTHWPPGHAERIRRSFGWHQCLRARPVFLGKSSMINFMLADVERLFPDARFIHIVRDGRAVALSYAEKEGRKMEAAADLYRGAGLWYEPDALIMHMGRLWQDTLAEIEQASAGLDWRENGRYHVCRYEDLCREPATVLRRLLEFIGVDDPALPPGEPVSDMNHKFRERLSAPLLRELTTALAPTLAAHGYATEVPAGG
jgi:hypothetical protein